MSDERNIIKYVDEARRFPTNTCPTSRHAQMIGEALYKGHWYPMLDDDPEYCGETILTVVAFLYEERTKCEQLMEEIEELKREKKVS